MALTGVGGRVNGEDECTVSLGSLDVQQGADGICGDIVVALVYLGSYLHRLAVHQDGDGAGGLKGGDGGGGQGLGGYRRRRW